MPTRPAAGESPHCYREAARQASVAVPREIASSIVPGAIAIAPHGRSRFPVRLNCIDGKSKLISDGNFPGDNELAVLIRPAT